MSSATILRADARALPLPDASVDLVLTSPPYFALRSYTDGGEHYAGQIGAEPTPQEYIESLLACTREWVRVLKPGGSIWVDLGDKYQATSFPPAKRGKDASGVERPKHTKACERCGEEFTGGPGRRFCSSYCGGSDNSPRASRGGPPVKSLMLLPERYRIACVDQLGLIARAVVIWSKPNGLPESVTDRVRRSHEDWVHLTKQPRYYSAVDEIRDGYAPETAKRYAAGYNPRKVDAQRPSVNTKLGGATYGENPLGKLPGSVWEVPTEPLTVPDHLGVDHFAAFPTEWPRRIILGWSPSGICVECGEGRRPVVHREIEFGSGSGRAGRPPKGKYAGTVQATSGTYDVRMGPITKSTITGEACACPDTTAPTRPAVVLDPFGGTGTTALVAKALGRHGISVDRSADYCRLAAWRTSDPGQLAKAMRVEKPPTQMDGQLDLLDMEGVA